MTVNVQQVPIYLYIYICLHIFICFALEYNQIVASDTDTYIGVAFVLYTLMFNILVAVIDNKIILSILLNK